jgi:hypothetical protein
VLGKTDTKTNLSPAPQIQFWKLNKERIFHTDLENPILYPAENYNSFSVRDLLLLCSPPVRYEEISELGAAIEVLLSWECKVKGKGTCVPKVKARRVDSMFDPLKIGFTFAYPHYTVGVWC